jgi:hypothetical protein
MKNHMSQLMRDLATQKATIRVMDPMGSVLLMHNTTEIASTGVGLAYEQ